jgi:hypothetical protein
MSSFSEFTLLENPEISYLGGALFMCSATCVLQPEGRVHGGAPVDDSLRQYESCTYIEVTLVDGIAYLQFTS